MSESAKRAMSRTSRRTVTDMPSNQLEAKAARCPFFRNVANASVTCEGITEDRYIKNQFRSKRDKKAHMEIYCTGNYMMCEIYRMLMENVYDGEGTCGGKLRCPACGTEHAKVLYLSCGKDVVGCDRCMRVVRDDADDIE